MRVFRGFSAIESAQRDRCVAIGFFDGVHRAHQAILKATVAQAHKLKALSTVVTFDPHPASVLSPGQSAPATLMSLRHKIREIQKIGLDEILVIPFNKKFSEIPHDVFLDEYLLKKTRMVYLAVGNDFCFGKNATGNSVFLLNESLKKNFKCKIFHSMRIRGKIVSSTAIRKYIEKGRLKNAQEMLGRFYSIYGTVVSGKGRGRALGFPTANIIPHHEALPPPGVYAVMGHLSGKTKCGVLHVGERPTFNEVSPTVEVHWLAWHGNLYGKEQEVVLIKKLRPIKKFRTPAQLQKAIQKDTGAALKVFSSLQGTV